MALPPFEMGAVKATLAFKLAEVATTLVGAPGTVLGITEAEELEATELPALVVATTVNVYVVPLVKPVTTIGELEPEAVILSGEEVTVYPVMALPPLEVGAVKATLACAFEAVAITLVGA
jgi:hypothetical protein